MVGRAHPTSLFSKLETFQGSSSWAFGPPINYEKFLMGILPTLNLEL